MRIFVLLSFDIGIKSSDFSIIFIFQQVLEASEPLSFFQKFRYNIIYMA